MSEYFAHPGFIMRDVEVGSREHSWADELREMWTEPHRSVTLDILDSVLQVGIREPLMIGDDGRLWDGHHRLAVAVALGLTSIPVTDLR
ncbi:hypothetical protein HQO24_10605 [Rhodococcus fascians]|nr:hypothetical protein [Rhodococcus fascians]MBY4396869.1 hypothetical protein [Rhodococcus fascians]MBY4407348.1 hypothetical protein [Rhodococcus fascians]MBY4421523.1 hypothetical protein [Rhodococcus fascians]MBY4460724.1 hypothetical protein [Rhodococcus fascians]